MSEIPVAPAKVPGFADALTRAKEVHMRKTVGGWLFSITSTTSQSVPYILQ